MKNFDLEDYFSTYHRLAFSAGAQNNLHTVADILADQRQQGGRLLLAGNGASAALASHCATDFTKQAGIQGMTFHDPALITAFSNDFGYDHWLKEAIKHYGRASDTAILISVSGESPNIINAARYCADQSIKVISLSGRDPDNQLVALSDVSLHVASDAYNIVESIHSIWLTALVDMLVGKAVYPVS